MRELKHLRWQRLRKGHSKSEFVLFIPSRLIPQMLAKFFGVKFYRKVFQCPKKGKGSCCLVFLSSTKREIRHFHIVVVQRRHRNVQKTVSCCFANLNQLPFCRSRCRRGTIGNGQFMEELLFGEKWHLIIKGLDIGSDPLRTKLSRVPPPPPPRPLHLGLY